MRRARACRARSPTSSANEGCERFSFYGMRNILTPFLVGSLLLYAPEAERAGRAKEVFHTFVIGVYFFPLLGGWLADRFFGKYNTIFWLSLVYCAGHACLAAFDDNRTGFYAGLFLIALGSGGIKPLVASFVGDQFDQTQQAPREARLRRVLLDHQLRLVLRLAADAGVSAQLRAERRLRHSRRADVHRHRHLLGRATKVRARAARRRRIRTRSCASRARRSSRRRPATGGPGSSSRPSARCSPPLRSR